MTYYEAFRVGEVRHEWALGYDACFATMAAGGL